MTRDFSKQRRDGQRPPSRNSFSSGRPGEEETSKPVRPRLSRDTVDRAWENGAPRKYADYRPRQNSSTPPIQRQGRPAPSFDRSRSPQNRGTYNPRPEQFRSSSPYQQRSSSYEGNQENSPRPFQQSGYRAPGQPGLNSERRTKDQGGFPPRSRGTTEPYREQRPQRPQQRNFNAPGRGNPRFEQGSQESGNGYRERENFTRGRQNNAPPPRRDNFNPRWQSRPTAQNEYEIQNEYQQPQQPQRPYQAPGQRYSAPRQYPNTSREAPQVPRRTEQFKGDYEHFETSGNAEKPGKPPFEKHVTRMQDGRVIKGPRPTQRKQATFWNEVETEAEVLRTPKPSLPEQTQIEQKPDVLIQQEQEQETSSPPHIRKQPARKPRTIKTVKTARAEKADTGPKTPRVPKKRGPGSTTPRAKTRPSQHGFKWPTAEET